jgi:hypothetical protein
LAVMFGISRSTDPGRPHNIEGEWPKGWTASFYHSGQPPIVYDL